jgi:hypothetical protein
MVAGQVPYCAIPAIYNSTMDSILESSPDMPAQIVSIDAFVPLPVLFKYISLGFFVDWNPLFNTVQTTNFQLCGPLDAVYSNGQFLTPILPPNINGPHYIIQLGCNEAGTQCAFGWWFNLFDQIGALITFGRHTFTFTQSPTNKNVTTVQSYEKAAGPNVASNSIPWTNALQESLVDAVIGIVCLERLYQSSGALNPADVANFCTHFSP